jgi:LPXTG-site transpeptidase (sortase) family protein
VQKITRRVKNLPPLSRISLLLILAGLIFLSLALFRSALAIQEYNSPFDEVDSSDNYEAGFLPLLSPEEDGGGPSGSAPGLVGLENRPGTGTGDNPVQDQPMTQPDETSDSALQEAPEASDPNSSPEENSARSTTNSVTQITGPPEWISIPAIGVDGPVVPVGLKEIEYKRQTFEQWTAPDMYAAGWHNTSALLGQIGNTVLNGHHNIYGEIFKNLVNLEVGDLIYLYSGDWVFTYKVGLNTRFNERFQPVEQRLQNARWILPSQDERLTIITCWPYESNTHRVVIVAIPVRVSQARNSVTP